MYERNFGEEQGDKEKLNDNREKGRRKSTK